jgi:hypothetical protein
MPVPQTGAGVKTLLSLLQLTQTLLTFHDYNFGLQVLVTGCVRRRMRWAVHMASTGEKRNTYEHFGGQT